MKKVIISPLSQKLRNGENNPKNYPYWKQVIALLKSKGVYTIQVGRSGQDEPSFDADELKFDLSYKDLENLVRECDTWACVDNFFHHMCSFVPEKPGVVIWGKSDPTIFGYAHNINLLKSTKYLRDKQFDIWEHESFSPNCWVTPEIVVQSIIKIID